MAEDPRRISKEIDMLANGMTRDDISKLKNKQKKPFMNTVKFIFFLGVLFFLAKALMDGTIPF